VSRRVLALFAKAPVPGSVKTRLVPPLSPRQAASLYEAMLLDILDQHVGTCDASCALWYTPPDSVDWFRKRAPQAYALRPQVGDTLGERMAHLFRAHAGEGFDRIVLRGTDSPTLPRERVAQAFGALESHDAVICPDLDGGYNLIGLGAPQDALFALEMSTSTVLEATLDRARTAGLRVHLLPSHFDVDTADDLERLAHDVSPALVPRTARWLAAERDSIRA
jgi:rSAM/selenodomain-associated transferase 1